MSIRTEKDIKTLNKSIIINSNKNDKDEWDEDEEKLEWKERAKNSFKKDIIPNVAQLRQYSSNTWKEIKKNKLGYVLGLLSCFLVVFVVGLMLSILDTTPVVFLRLAELSNGEIDLKLSAGGWTGYSLLNYTKIESLWGNSPNSQRFQYSSARSTGVATITMPKYCVGDAQNLPSDQVDWKYDTDQCLDILEESSGDGEISEDVVEMVEEEGNCFDLMCLPQMDVTLFVLDGKKEERMGIGRQWNLDIPTEVGN